MHMYSKVQTNTVGKKINFSEAMNVSPCIFSYVHVFIIIMYSTLKSVRIILLCDVHVACDNVCCIMQLHVHVVMYL